MRCRCYLTPCDMPTSYNERFLLYCYSGVIITPCLIFSEGISVGARRVMFPKGISFSRGYRTAHTCVSNALLRVHSSLSKYKHTIGDCVYVCGGEAK